MMITNNVPGTVDEESFIHQFQAPGSILVVSRKDLDLQLASVYTSLSSRDWRRRIEVNMEWIFLILILTLSRVFS